LPEVLSGELLLIRAVSKFLEEIGGVVFALVAATHFINHRSPVAEVARLVEVGLEQQFREEVHELGNSRVGED
jgi:hypothetical protein